MVANNHEVFVFEDQSIESRATNLPVHQQDPNASEDACVELYSVINV